MLYADERPQTFDEVREQEFVIKNLQSQAKKGVFFNSIILCGKYGTGKTTVARIIARAANCENRDENGNPCLVCASCRSINDRSGTDVIEIDGASNNGVDAARKLMKEINYIPMSRYRVIIIDECHRISSSAWDALLKTLEEPPEHAMFILCTTDETALPETIRSRAPVYRFEPISAGTLSRHAKETAAKHGIKISDSALDLLAAYADGSMRNMLSLLEQMSMQGSDITECDVETLLGINHCTFTVGFVSGMLSGNLDTCIGQMNSLVSEGRSVRLFAKDIMRTAVDMVLQKTGITPGSGSAEYLGLIKQEAARHSMAKLNILAELAADLEKRMRKESDTYAMYGGIISIVRELQKDAPHTGRTEDAAPDIMPVPVPTPGSEGSVLSRPEENHDSPDGGGINRNISVLPDLEQALMDFMPDLKRKPQGRFDTGIHVSTNNPEDDGMDRIETDDALPGEPEQCADYSRTSGGNGIMPYSGMMSDAYYGGTDSHEHGEGVSTPDGDGYGTGLPPEQDDFDRRWEEARQKDAGNSGFPTPAPVMAASAKGFNIFGLPPGLGIPDMGKKRSFT